MNRGILYLAVILGITAVFVLPSLVSAQEEETGLSQVLEIYNPLTFEKEGEIPLPQVYDRLSFQVADMGTDGQEEIIVGAPAGELPEVTILRKDGSEISRFMAYGAGYQGGVNVVVSDVNHDGLMDIITGSRETGGPHVRVFTGDGQVISEFFAFDAGSRAGVTIAAGDLTAEYPGDEIVVVEGEGQPSLLRIFTYQGELLSEWYPFDEDFYGGVNMDVTPDGQIIVTRAFGKSPLVRIFNRFGGLESEFMAYYEDFPGGVYAQVFEQPHGGWDVYTVPGFSGGPHVRNFSADGRALSPGFNAFGGDYKGGLIFDMGDIDGDGQVELIVGQETMIVGPTDTIKSIVVDLSEQTLTTYYRGLERASYLISSGLDRFPTPIGKFKVYRKREVTNMSWTYGPGNPDNYDLPGVPHVLSFTGPYTIHGAYWHNNFGYQMSHGCVNMALPDAEEVYNWADMGTTVVVQP